MRRADRLFQIIQQLHHERATTARDLAETLVVSERTIYRDVQDLSLSGVPITGEAGVGYRLMPGFHMPPLMFNEEELAALLLGARMVQVWTDKSLARAAQQAIGKIVSALPERLKPELAREEMLVPDFSISLRQSLMAPHLSPFSNGSCIGTAAKCFSSSTTGLVTISAKKENAGLVTIAIV